jgi:hypothetical protein
MSFSCAPSACWRAALHGAIDSGRQDAACAFTMNSVARETFHIYIQFS